MQRNEWIEMITVPEVPQFLAAGKKSPKYDFNEVKRRKCRGRKLVAS
jgi:hypothetical protein